MRIRARYASIVMGSIVSAGMSFFMSFAMIAFCIGFPAASAMVPIARKITAKISVDRQ